MVGYTPAFYCAFNTQYRCRTTALVLSFASATLTVAAASSPTVCAVTVNTVDRTFISSSNQNRRFGISSLRMTIRRCTGLSGVDGGTLRSLVVMDDDSGSLLVSSSPPPRNSGPVNSVRLCSPSTFVFVEQRLRLLLFVIFSLLPSLAILVAISTWTYTSAKVEHEVMKNAEIA